MTIKSIAVEGEFDPSLQFPVLINGQQTSPSEMVLIDASAVACLFFPLELYFLLGLVVSNISFRWLSIFLGTHLETIYERDFKER